MARNKRTKFKAYRKDMSKGGRVSYAAGDAVLKAKNKVENTFNEARKQKIASKDTPLKRAIKNKPSSSRGEQEYNQVRNIKTPAPSGGEPVLPIQQNGDAPMPTIPGGTPPVTPSPTPSPTPAPTPAPRDVPEIDTPISESPSGTISPAAREREFRVDESAKRQEDIATGKLGIEELGLKAKAATATVSADEIIDKEDPKFKIDPTGIPLDSAEYQARAGTDEQVRQGVRAPDVGAPQPITTSKIEDVAQIDKAPDLEAAQGQVSDEAIAQAAQVDRITPIEGAEVEIIPGALTERVVGVLSPEAKATAAENVGSSLARVTRAKKQLTNAGLNEEDITELGNDPEALEARLMEFSETQRGIIEGLPEEALVSNQLDTLINGIEEGEIPTWARPAVASVEKMLAQRGMSASTVGRDALFNAIITSAMPLAQANAQAIQASVGQQKSIEAQEAEANAARAQQTGLQNAQTVFQMDMAQFNADQQTALSNSKFLQTVGITEANFDQQSTVQNALLMSQANLAEADFYQKSQIQNAQAFLQMDMANLNAKQQTNVLRAQQEQQVLLSNQAADNAAKQFNAASENQTQQFMTNLNTQVKLNNAQRNDAMQQFNAVQANQAEARRAQRETDVNKFNAQLAASVDQYNSQQTFAREQFNAQNSLVIEQSNVQWRRGITKANTAAQQQINMLNAQQAYGITTQAQASLWQEVRDEFDYIWKSAENAANRETNIAVAGMQGENSALKGPTYMTRLEDFLALFDPTD